MCNYKCTGIYTCTLKIHVYFEKAIQSAEGTGIYTSTFLGLSVYPIDAKVYILLAIDWGMLTKWLQKTTTRSIPFVYIPYGIPRSMNEATKTEIVAFFNTSSQHVYRMSDLGKILSENRAKWGGISSWTQPKFVHFLLENTDLKKVTLRSGQYEDESRYIWRHASEYEIALSLRRNSYLSHATAIFLHGLNNQIPATIYVNHEQSVKPRRGTLTQEGIHRAFKSPQRQSNYIFEYGKKRILVVNGKNTGRLGVIHLTASTKETLEVTNMERTLIDSSVRPAYAGGIFQVVEAFKRARGTVSADQLVATLKQLDYVYPYHQVIGFYMEKAGYDESSLAKMEKLGLAFDFYATYGLKKTEYNKRWRLFHPRGM